MVIIIITVTFSMCKRGGTSKSFTSAKFHNILTSHLTAIRPRFNSDLRCMNSKRQRFSICIWQMKKKSITKENIYPLCSYAFNANTFRCDHFSWNFIKRKIKINRLNNVDTDKWRFDHFYMHIRDVRASSHSRLRLLLANCVLKEIPSERNLCWFIFVFAFIYVLQFQHRTLLPFRFNGFIYLFFLFFALFRSLRLTVGLSITST